MTSNRKVDKSAFIQFCKQLASVWGSTPFEELLQEAREELLKPLSLADFKKYNNLDSGYGIYCFWLEQKELDDLKNFKAVWNKTKGTYKITQPTQKWYSKNQVAKNGLRPFYMGKREDVVKRIQEHAFKSSKSTYGLHLYRNKTEWQDNIFVSYFILPKEALSELSIKGNEDKYLQQLVLSFLETRLRQEFSPMVGKQ
ncbi:hypothetical protein [Leeuwenhoekiella sp. H156]|uniref:hypothetical protein n=1 Tax=Leeuwenhoekiella sp. H156 TaxID=3450128 RepID=UPI003FA45A07